jgi:hypothetical protein
VQIKEEIIEKVNAKFNKEEILEDVEVEKSETEVNVIESTKKIKKLTTRTKKENSEPAK